jgi:uncharacterized membrane protein
MSLYELFLTVHVLGAVAWIGSGLVLLILATQAARAGDGEAIGRFVDETASLGGRLFIPASLITVAMGVALTVDGHWSLGDLWIALGLAGFLATFLTGVLVMKPRSDAIAELRRREGGMTADAVYQARRMLVLGRLDYVVLVMVIVDMVVKPTGDDAGVLVAMALVLLAGVAYVLTAYRGIEQPAPQPA